MIKCAVIGNPIEHSLSPIIHQQFAQQTSITLDYQKIQGDNEHFAEQVENFFSQGGKGLNVTLPFKEKAFQLADVATPRCELAKAANTLWMQDNQLHADNTDGIGLIRDLTRHVALAGKHILILGAGGAARGIIGALYHEQVSSITVANRSAEKLIALQKDYPFIKNATFEDLKGNYEVIINATSAGLSSEGLLVPMSLWRNQPFCYDLMYALHQKTAFVQQATAMGCQAVDGLGMLVEQAAEAFFIWHGVRADPLGLNLTPKKN